MEEEVPSALELQVLPQGSEAGNLLRSLLIGLFASGTDQKV
jgi:hypothetical protein